MKTKAFYKSKQLQHIYLNKGLENIDSEAFGQILSLKEIQIPSTVKSIGSHAFASSGLTSVNFEGKEQPSPCVVTAFQNTVITQIEVIPEYNADVFCGKLAVVPTNNGCTSILILSTILLFLLFII